MKKLVFLAVLVALFVMPAVTAFSQGFGISDAWYSYDDSGDGGNSVLNFVKENRTIDGVEYFVLDCKGSVTTKFQYGYIGFGLEPTGDDLAKLRKAKGIKFKVIGDGQKYRVSAETSGVKDYDYHGKFFFTKAGQSVEVTVPFNYMQQQGWGTKAGFVQSTLNKISFQTVGQPIPSVDFVIYDFQLIY